jgi:hypothetical protein
MKALAKYLPLLFILLFAGYGRSFSEATRQINLRGELGKVFSTRETHTAGQSVFSNPGSTDKKPNRTGHQVAETGVEEEDFSSSKKHLNAAIAVYMHCLSDPGQYGRFLNCSKSIFAFNKYFSYTATFRYLALQAFRI